MEHSPCTYTRFEGRVADMEAFPSGSLSRDRQSGPVAHAGAARKPRPETRGGRRRDEHERTIVIAAKHGDARDRERLIEAFRPSISGIARMYRNSTRVEWNELMQEGAVGLLRALERYDVQLGIPFWAYASWWVRQAMQQVVSELSRPLVLSDRALRQLARVKAAQRSFEQARGREPTCADLAAVAGLPTRQIECLVRTDRTPRGLDEPAGGESGERATPAEMLADPPAEEAYERAEQRLLTRELPRLLELLDERERTVICSRYGIGRPERTLREIGQTLGVSAERVRQIEQVSLGKLKLAAA
jgi:RNA polymerase sigma factor (sigma-70 family)